LFANAHETTADTLLLGTIPQPGVLQCDHACFLRDFCPQISNNIDKILHDACADLMMSEIPPRCLLPMLEALLFAGHIYIYTTSFHILYAHVCSNSLCIMPTPSQGPYIRTEIPLVVMFRALGIVADRDILERIVSSRPAVSIELTEMQKRLNHPKLLNPMDPFCFLSYLCSRDASTVWIWVVLCSAALGQVRHEWFCHVECVPVIHRGDSLAGEGINDGKRW